MNFKEETVLRAEKSLLGSLMIDPSKITEVSASIEPLDFLDEKNKQIYEAILRLDEGGISPDTTTLFTEVQGRGAFLNINASEYIFHVYEITPTALSVMTYADFVKQASVNREVHSAVTDIIERMNMGDGNTDEITSLLIEKVERAIERAKKSEFKDIKNVTQEVFGEIVARMTGEGKSIALSTGFSSLDQLIGLGDGDLVILAARPSMGKTAFALNIALNVAGRHHKNEEDKKTIALFSLEMGADQLVSRMICSEGLLDSEKIKRGNLDPEDLEKLTNAVELLNQKKIYIEDSAYLKVNDVKAKCKNLQNESGLDLVIIDYLQLLQGSRRTDNRQQEVSEISRTLKQMARELECPVIALSQLSRSVESRQDKRPMMSDLRESGSIEQDADIVSFLYRGDYYRSEDEDGNTKEVGDTSTVEVIIAKNRNGQTGTAELAFMKKYNKFVGKDLRR